MALTHKFKTSSYCPWWCSPGECVEVAKQGDEILVRDSKNPEQAVLRFNKQEWDVFIKGVKQNEFDL